MATFDREQQKIVLRIVYDGPARAGKTTNVQQLCGLFSLRRRSELFVPEEMAGRTLFFDWMHLDAGLVAGHQLRCQIVSVPGQRRLAARRKYILQTADVVVFVCSSGAGSVDTSRAMLETLRWSLRSADRSEVPIVVQANKQDLKSALGAEALREALDLHADVEIVPARARDAVGVRETSVAAIRAGAMRVKQVLMEQGLDAISGRLDGAPELLARLREMGGGAAGWGDTVDELLDLREEDEEPPWPGERRSERPSAPVTVVAPAPAGEGERSESVAEDSRPPRPSGDIVSGCVWPSISGRQVLRAACRETWRRCDAAAPSAPDARAGAVVYQAGPWCAKTSAERRYDDAEQARAALLRMARRKIQLGGLLLPRTVISLHEDDRGGAWIWTVAPWMRTLRAEMAEAASSGDDQKLTDAVVRYARAVSEATRMAARGVPLDVQPDNFAALEGQIFYLGDEPDADGGAGATASAVLRQVEDLADHGDAAEAFVQQVVTELTAHLSAEELQALSLIEAFEEAAADHPLAVRARGRITASLARHAQASGVARPGVE
ncbi:MAG: ADP-ribosylation factor-like protein [Myxococcales bacterium]|jgi:hypothetical protein